MAEVGGGRGRLRAPRGAGVDYAAEMMGASFQALTQEEKDAAVGDVLNKLTRRADRADSRIADHSRLYSKYCLQLYGADLPPPFPNEDCVVTFAKVALAKWNIRIKESERFQFKNVHRLGNDKGIIAAFNTIVGGSVFERVIWRKDPVTGVFNWNGQHGGDPALRIEVERYVAPDDHEIVDAGLFMRLHYGKDGPNCRVSKVNTNRSGVVTYHTPRGLLAIHDLSQALEMMEPVDRENFLRSKAVKRLEKAKAKAKVKGSDANTTAPAARGALPSGVMVRKCRLTRNVIPMFCGNYDHQTLITTDIWYIRPIPITPEECRRFHDNKAYIIRTQPSSGVFEDKVFALKINSTNQIQYNLFGRMYLTDSEVECTGAK